MIDNLYNPDSMSKEDIKTLFVARQPLLDELVSTVKNQPQGAGVQHVLIIAPRGMGKTTMLLMLQFAIEDSAELSKEWQPIRFPEESYGITELADFWLKVLHYLADATKDETLETKIEEIEKRFPKSEDLREAAWALVKDWSKNHKKRIALMVDNFDMILSQIGNNTEQARLRDILMNDGTIMLIGCAPSYFREIQDYGQPLYNFFKISNLSDLKFADIEELLRRRAEVDEIENIEELLQKNRTRIKALEAFTGGNPRLVLMLYRIITSSDMTEVRKGLERLLDAVTPYYKDKTEKLPPQQRKIIDQIAQYSLEKREGISPTEIAQRIRMTPNQVSSQLKRLAENGYVRSLNIRGRSSFYTLSEPLYAIWSQMRFGRNAREKRNWLVQILKAIYDAQEIQREIQKAGEKYVNLVNQGQKNKARGTLEFLACLMETYSNLIQENFPLVIHIYLELNEDSSILETMTLDKMTELPKETIEILVSRGILKDEDLKQYYTVTLGKSFNIFFNFLTSVAEDFSNQKESEAIKDINEFISVLQEKISKDSEYELFLSMLHTVRAGFFQHSGRFDEAIEESDKAIEIFAKHGEKVERAFAMFLAIAHWVRGLSSFQKIKIDETIFNFNESARFIDLLIEQGNNQKFIFEAKSKIYFYKTQIWFVLNQPERATIDFQEYMRASKQIESKNWIEDISSNLIQISRFTNLQNIKKVIQESKLEEEFFPLMRSIDYLETKDEDLIEKLSPEVRVVVEETIRTLQMVSEEKPKSKPTQKVKNKKDRKSEKSLALSE